MSWFQIILVEGQINSNYHTKLYQDFQECFKEHLFERGFAVFVDIRGSKKQMRFYLPPIIESLCEHLITAYAPIPCEKPAWENIKLVVGQPGAVLEYFR
jgi:hypothetical protein